MRAFIVIVCLAFGGTVDASELRSVDRGSESEPGLPRLPALLEIIRRQQRFRSDITDHYNNRPHLPQPAAPLIGIAPVVVVEKGRTATVRHTISWRAYDSDELTVRVTPSDASLVVPERLNLEFEKHEFRFEYQVKAGDKTGEFTVTLAPAVGAAVRVRVTVK